MSKTSLLLFVLFIGVKVFETTEAITICTRTDRLALRQADWLAGWLAVCLLVCLGVWANPCTAYYLHLRRGWTAGLSQILV